MKWLNLPEGLNDGWLDGPDDGWELGADDTVRGDIMERDNMS